MKRDTTFLYRYLPLIAALIVLPVVGCSGGHDGPPLAAVSGVVTLNGQPLKQTQVVFQPVENAATSRGLSDDAGNFKVYYPPDVPGAVLGKHRVQFLLMDAEVDPRMIPKKYRMGSPGIEVEVTEEGPNEFEFELSGK